MAAISFDAPSVGSVTIHHQQWHRFRGLRHQRRVRRRSRGEPIAPALRGLRHQQQRWVGRLRLQQRVRWRLWAESISDECRSLRPQQQRWAGRLRHQQPVDGVHGESQSAQHAGVSGINNSGGPGVYGTSTSDPVRAFGAVIGKALKPWRNGCGLIPILISLQ